MMISFTRDAAGFAFARADTNAGEALAGLLSSDVSDAILASELIENLTRAQDSGQHWEGTWNAYTVEARGTHARVEFAIDDSVGPVDTRTSDLIGLLSSWRTYLLEGSPTTWRIR